MRKLTILLFIALSLSGFSQGPMVSSKVHHFKMFNWTVRIPAGFEAIDKEKWADIENRGKEALENTYGQEIIDETTTLFMYRNTQFNVFESNYQPFDESVDGRHEVSCNEVNKMLFKTFQAQLPNVPMDSTSATEVIAGRTFQTFYVKINLPNQTTLKSLMFSSYFKELKKELTISITAIDDAQLKLMLEAFESSTF